MLKDIQDKFAEIITNLQPGEVVHIVSGDKVLARLTSEQRPVSPEIEKTETKVSERKPGSAVGTLRILSEDDEHLADFSEYMS